MGGRMLVWTVAVRSCADASQERKETGTEPPPGRPHATRGAALWARRRSAHEGPTPRRGPLQGPSSSGWQVAQPPQPGARMPPRKESEHARSTSAGRLAPWGASGPEARPVARGAARLLKYSVAKHPVDQG